MRRSARLREAWEIDDAARSEELMKNLARGWSETPGVSDHLRSNRPAPEDTYPGRQRHSL